MKEKGIKRISLSKLKTETFVDKKGKCSINSNVYIYFILKRSTLPPPPSYKYTLRPPKPSRFLQNRRIGENLIKPNHREQTKQIHDEMLCVNASENFFGTAVQLLALSINPTPTGV